MSRGPTNRRFLITETRTPRFRRFWRTTIGLPAEKAVAHHAPPRRDRWSRPFRVITGIIVEPRRWCPENRLVGEHVPPSLPILAVPDGNTRFCVLTRIDYVIRGSGPLARSALVSRFDRK